MWTIKSIINRFKRTSNMSGKQQKAVFVTEIGQPVQLGKRDIPSPKSGEILVKVTATMRTSCNSSHNAAASLNTYYSTAPRYLRPRLGPLHRREASIRSRLQCRRYRRASRRRRQGFEVRRLSLRYLRPDGSAARPSRTAGVRNPPR